MTKFDGEKLIIDPSDYEGMISLMERASEFPMPWSGKNDDGEETMVSIGEDNIIMETCQNNGWLRENTYWKDGTVEESYHK